MYSDKKKKPNQKPQDTAVKSKESEGAAEENKEDGLADSWYVLPLLFVRLVTRFTMWSTYSDTTSLTVKAL